MTERRRTSWSALADEWDPNHPAIARMRDALALPPTAEPVQDAPGRPEPEIVASGSPHAPEEPPAPPQRNRVAELVARLQAGDLSAVDMLRKLVDRS